MQFVDSRGPSDPNIIRLKSGESVTGVLRGDPYTFEHAFKPGDKPKFRFKLNIIVPDQGNLTAKVIEGGWKLYNQLADAHKAGWDLEKSYTKISRQGSTVNDTVYSATVMPTPVSAETLAKVANVRLHKLDIQASASEPDTSFNPDSF